MENNYRVSGNSIHGICTAISVLGSVTLKKITSIILFINISVSLILFLNKWILNGAICPTCTSLFDHQMLSALSLIASILVFTLYKLAERYSIMLYISLASAGILAFIASLLMMYQYSLGHLVCHLCFASEVMFYVVFIALITEYKVPALELTKQHY